MKHLVTEVVKFVSLTGCVFNLSGRFGLPSL